MLKQTVTEEQIWQKLDELLYLYPNAYSRLEVIHIYQNYYLGYQKNYIDNVIQEALDEIGVLEEKTNIYKLYIDLLEKNYGLNQRIIEVGGGRFSRVAKRIAKRQTSGTITVYDPKLVPQKVKDENLFLLKEEFNYNTDLRDAKLLTGLLPCDATYPMIDMACRYKINFQIALCDCLIPDELIEKNKEEAFNLYVIRHIRNAVKHAGMGNLEVTNFKEHGFNNPIVYTKFRK